jgi:heterotetrameric sarcosine oxidase gamma subunit
VAEFGLKATTSLAGLALPGRYGRPDGEPGCYIAERSGLVLKQIGARRRRTNEVLRGACEALGLELADAPRRAALDGLAIIGTAPGQRMAVAQGAKGRDLLARLENALKGFATFVDQSDAKAVLRFWGRNARDVLAKGCPLDLHERAFHPQDAATTQIALISCLLWQLDEAPTFELAVPLSYVGSFWSWLTASAAEFGYEVTPLSLDESLR